MNHDDLANYSHTEVNALKKEIADLTKELQRLRAIIDLCPTCRRFAKHEHRDSR